jgi:sulfur carrier protein
LKITLNGKEETMQEGVTIANLISLKGLAPDNLIVEYNHGVVKKETWPDIVLREDDQVEILRFVGGG